MADAKPTLIKPLEEVTPIVKPSASRLDKFKAKHTAVTASVGTLPTSLPHYKFAEAKDFVRLHENEEEYWSAEWCFVSVPVKGQKKDTMHLIDEDLALQYLPKGKLSHFRLALATKPFDIFFLCHIPTRNLDNKYNSTTLEACEQAKTRWVQLTSKKEDGIEDYERTFAHDADAIPSPKWPTQSLDELVERAFGDCMIDREDHPALLRLRLAKQALG